MSIAIVLATAAARNDGAMDGPLRALSSLPRPVRKPAAEIPLMHALHSRRQVEARISIQLPGKRPPPDIVAFDVKQATAIKATNARVRRQSSHQG
ncbi:MAG: hypothetical protein JNL39_12180 [Opitutaceae bacterium]|nr:hypothetical protein [Opitutaceae bacterium]